MNKLLLLLLFCITFSTAKSQEYIDGEIIIETSLNARQLQHNISRYTSLQTHVESLSAPNQYYKLITDSNENIIELIANLNLDPLIKYAIRNVKVKYRRSPNDELYSQQLASQIINLEKAWELTTGSKTTDDQEIVIAVIDEGVDLEHEDLVENYWTNPDEIPNDNLDNDGNGYVDDYLGMYTQTNNDKHPLNNHGTSVCGIIGAKGDNGIGVTGVNWDVKIMPITITRDLASIIESYCYILDQRRMFNSSDGTLGAYVVATNSSWGIDTVFADEFPIWCDLYEAMGNQGIISVVATSNLTLDVDELGDMPSTCSSKYIIAVTNTESNNAINGGFGFANIDIGAPGNSTFSTENLNQYGTFSGTSGACPLVAGTIGLLYSLNASFLATGKNPSDLACEMKEIILKSVRKVSTLDNKSSSGGILDVAASLNELLDCHLVNDGNEISFCSISPNPTSNFLQLEIIQPNCNDYQVLIFDDLGRLFEIIKRKNVSDIIDEFEVDISDYPSGIYFVTIDDQKNKSTHSFSKI